MQMKTCVLQRNKRSITVDVTHNGAVFNEYDMLDFETSKQFHDRKKAESYFQSLVYAGYKEALAS